MVSDVMNMFPTNVPSVERPKMQSQGSAKFGGVSLRRTTVSTNFQ